MPLDWGVDNAGERVAENLYALQVLAPGSDAAGPIDLCIAEFEPVYDPGSVTPPVDGPYLNSDGFIRLENNTFGIQGPVFAIGDGVSTTQSGNPYKNGKYWLSGTFSGAEADWGAGARILSEPPARQRNQGRLRSDRKSGWIPDRTPRQLARAGARSVRRR